MRLDDLEESQNVEDRRGRGGGRIAAGGGLGAIVLAILYIALGGSARDAQQILGQQPSQSAPSDPNADKFVKKVLRETEIVWTDLFKQQGLTYQDPTLVLFTGQVDSACGYADAAVGPFYCPGDDKVYIDLDFYDVMREKLGADGDFAQAYVIAHEVGHHVQDLLGVSDKVTAMQQRASDTERNRLSVRLELQADFYAGVWASHAKDLHLDKQDIEEALNAAHQIGDDTLQKHSQGYVVPDSFTHGTSAQRMRWFMKGYQTGDMTQGDTFNTRNL